MKVSKKAKALLQTTRKPYALGKRLAVDISLSENPLGCSPRTLMALKSSPISQYPDPKLVKLKRAISQCFKVPVATISIGNGSEALIDLIPRILLDPQNEAIIPETTFPLFEKGVVLAGGKPVFSKMKKDFSIDLEDIKKKITKKTKLIFLCNPNNPTGKVLKGQKIIKFVRNVSPLMVLVDEANIDFAGQSVMKDVKRLKNLIVLRSFSKGPGLAGLRIGFCVGPREFIKVLERARQPFPVSVLSEKAAIASLQDKKFIEKSKKFMKQQRGFLTEELRQRGFKVIDSSSNNILVKVDGFFDSSTRLTRLLSQKGVSVVDGVNFRGLGKSFIRITPGLTKTNKKFLKVIDQILKENSL